MGLGFAMFVFLTFRGPLASHDSNPYPHRSRIARYNATKHCMSGVYADGYLIRSSKKISEFGDSGT